MTSTILLSHLQEPTETSIRLSTLQSVLSHQLSIAPSTSTATSRLTVTQLTATAISSPFFHPASQAFECVKVQAFETAFRHAIHLLRQQRSKSDHGNLTQWTRDVITGVQGGHPILRLAACGGILLGVEDLTKSADPNKAPIQIARTLVESETVVALAEVLDSTTVVYTEWEHEFQLHRRSGRQILAQDALLIAFVLASHSLPLVDPQKLSALPMYVLARLLTGILVSFFRHSDPNSDAIPDPNSPTDLSQVPSLAKLTSIILSALVNSTHARSYARTLGTLSDTFNALLDLSRTIEQTYIENPSHQIPKQFLFTTLSLSQSFLSSIIYLRPQSIARHPDSSLTPSSIALTILQTLTNLSLVISQFGGVTKAFEQLPKVFYLCIDVTLSSGWQKNSRDKGNYQENKYEDVEAYVLHLSQFLQTQAPEAVPTLPFLAKLSFALSTFEQLVPVLSPHSIINNVWAVCYPCLTNPSDLNRQIYELAHSVVLSVLVHDSQRRQEFNSRPLLVLDDEEWTRFVQRLVSFYAQCLDTTLTVPQLRHAASSLVQCAAVLSAQADHNTMDSASTAPITTAAALPWYCVQLILDTIDKLSFASPSESHPPLSHPASTSSPPKVSKKDREHRLRLMLVFMLLSLPAEMMGRCLERVRGILVDCHEGVVPEREEERESEKEREKELVQALFEVLLSEQMGGEKKELGVKWWYDNLGLVHAVGGSERKGPGMVLQSRL